MEKKDKVIFGDLSVAIEADHTEQEIKEALEEMAPAIKHARGERSANGDGTYTWRFTEQAGTKG